MDLLSQQGQVASRPECDLDLLGGQLPEIRGRSDSDPVARSDGAPPRGDAHRENYAIGIAGGERGPEQNYSVSGSSGSDKAAAEGKDRRGGAGIDVELLQDVRHVIADRTLANR